MTDDEIRIAIAEACGKRIHYGDGPLAVVPGGWLENSIRKASIPDYTNDLNACHEMEKTLITQGSYGEFVGNLMTENPSMDFVTHATARQRCEAFLLTVGKWKD